jgi:hypothetical protein
MVKFFGRKNEYLTLRVEVIKKNWTENYDPYGYRVPFWMSDKVKIGQVEKGKSGKIIATVTDLENYERGPEETELYLTVEVEALLNKRTGVYTFKDKPINLGSPIELTLNNIDIIGQVVDNNVPKNGYPKKYFLVKARGRNLDPWLYSKVKPGIKMYNRANNDMIAEILKVETENSSLQKIKIDNSGNYLQSVVSQNKDIVVEFRLKGYQLDGKWYFSGHQNLKISNQLYFYSDEFNLYELEIEDIKETN